MAKRILVVDDDVYIREIYVEVLKHAGYEVDNAEDGEIALVKLTEGGYDLVLLDVIMPHKNGIEVLDELFKNPPTKKNGPVVLLTNSVEDPMIEKAKEKGVTGWAIKVDLAPPELLSLVKKHIEGQ
jgi:two-component system chemotaxis response regulator CheY